MSSQSAYSAYKAGSIKTFTKLIVLAVTLLVATAASASPSTTTDEIRSLVEENTNRLMAKLEQEKSSYFTDRETFYKEMDEALSELVSFRRIAGRVMGKHARKATKQQRSRFLTVFKRSMYESYSKALVESGVASMDVKKVTMNPRSNKKATVNIKVTSGSGNQFDIVYSVFHDKSGAWMVENVVVSGINVGLAFRDRFNQAYRNNKGDIEAVIETWSTTLDVHDEASEGLAIN